MSDRLIQFGDIYKGVHKETGQVDYFGIAEAVLTEEERAEVDKDPEKAFIVNVLAPPDPTEDIFFRCYTSTPNTEALVPGLELFVLDPFSSTEDDFISALLRYATEPFFEYDYEYLPDTKVEDIPNLPR